MQCLNIEILWVLWTKRNQEAEASLPKVRETYFVKVSLKEKREEGEFI
jgi:hypothetical protein